MKVSNNKPDVSSQVSNNSDSASVSQSNMSGDFFSDLIASLLASSSEQAIQDPDANTIDDNSENTQDSDTEQAAANTELTMLNPLLAQYMPPNAPTTNVNLRNNSTSTNNLESLTVTDKLNSTDNTNIANNTNTANQQTVYQQAIATDQTILNQAKKVISTAELMKMMQVKTAAGEDDNTVEMQKNNVSQSVDDLIDKKYQPQKSEAQTKVVQAVDLQQNQLEAKQKKIEYSQALQFDQRLADAREVNAINSQHQIKSSLTSADSTPELNPVQQQQAGAITVYSLQKGQVDYIESKKNKYVDALVQLGDVINSHTAQTIDSEAASASVPNPGSSSYADIFTKVNRPDYELKIELIPQSLESLMQETYNANIKIYPPELGSVIARLKMDKNKTELVLTAENSRVKEIIEANLSQLKENFKNSDINLTNIIVDVQTSHSGTGDQQSQNKSSGEINESQDGILNANKKTMPAKTTVQRLNALVDTYA